MVTWCSRCFVFTTESRRGVEMEIIVKNPPRTTGMAGQQRLAHLDVPEATSETPEVQGL